MYPTHTTHNKILYWDIWCSRLVTVLAASALCRSWAESLKPFRLHEIHLDSRIAVTLLSAVTNNSRSIFGQTPSSSIYFIKLIEFSCLSQSWGPSDFRTSTALFLKRHWNILVMEVRGRRRHTQHGGRLLRRQQHEWHAYFIVAVFFAQSYCYGDCTYNIHSQQRATVKW